MQQKQKKYFGPPRKKVDPSEMVYGIQPVLEAIEAGKEIDKLLVSRETSNSQLSEIIKRAQDLKIPVSRVPDQKLEKITRKNHQGVIGFMSAIAYASLDNIVSELYQEGKTPFILVLDRVTDVRNFGAIARTAECAGMHAIVIPSKGSAQIGSDAIRTSAGALSHIPVCRTENLMEAIHYLKNSGLQVVACTEKGGDTIYTPDYSAPTAIVMGSEEDGISNEIMIQSDYLSKIPMGGRVGSLNVSVAAGIIIFEALRQKTVN
ncbi:23S rRNA (guanosine(2251)-2'-O)-methyltransferase RlmB [Limibacter armeniacum]|uniref:23S rRNA (guanosine(2251)-2'-O)-methyltransferase RlmB n=1 Tax=Limibacter armeniacum TaxID=466084 RepID=UPI002FE5F6C3